MQYGFSSMNTHLQLQPHELALAVEERGFESLWYGEHSQIPIDRKSPHPRDRELLDPYKYMMALLESDAAGDVAERASDADLAQLRALHDRLEKLVRQREAFLAANEAFHLALLQIAGNRWRSQVAADLRKVMKLNRHHSLLKQGRLADSLAEHRALMAAIASRQRGPATTCMLEHFRNGLAAAAAPIAEGRPRP